MIAVDTITRDGRSIDDYVDAVVAEAPALSDDQIAALRDAFAPSRNGHAEPVRTSSTYSGQAA